MPGSVSVWSLPIPQREILRELGAAQGRHVPFDQQPGVAGAAPGHASPGVPPSTNAPVVHHLAEGDHATARPASLRTAASSMRAAVHSSSGEVAGTQLGIAW